MKVIKIFVTTILSLFLAGSFLIYFSFLYILPAIINSEKNIRKFENKVFEITGLKIVTDNFNFASAPNLKIKISADKIIIYTKNDAEMIDITKLSSNISLKNLVMKEVFVEEIDINGDELNKYIQNVPKNSDKRTFNIDLKKIPAIAVNKIQYISKSGIVYVKDFDFINNIGTFNAEIKTPALKNNLLIGNQGHLRLVGNELYAENFHILFGRNVLDMNGKIFDNKKDFDFVLKGKDLPVDDIEKSLLFYQKSQDPAKKFIENFKNYSGTIDVDLNVKRDGIFGKCIAKNLSANAVWFNIPIFFKEAVFDFKGKEITSIAEGLFGGEKVIHTLDITNFGNPEKEVIGKVQSLITKNFKYIPDLYILNSADAKLIYNIKNKIINVQYNLDLKEGSDLLYKNAYLGLRDKHRKFNALTEKTGNNLYIKKYDYSISENNTNNVIIKGDGLFVKENGHFKPQYITCKTNGFAPTSVTGSFKQYLDGGEFNGDLKYDFNSNKLIGDFEVVNTRFRDFYVNSAKIKASKDVFIQAFGLYLGELFTCDINAKNYFGDDNIVINNMNLFLDKFVIRHSKKKTNQKIDISSTVKNTDITIENWNIALNEIRKGKIVLNNIKLLGSLKENIFNFAIPKLDYAQGILSATGKYNFNNEFGVIDFTAKDINSDIVADMIFDLPGQVEGIADATLHTEFYNKLEDIKANAWFNVDNGFLPELGSTKFMKSKVKISDLVNIDFSKKKALQSDIQGTFDFDNSHVKNINLTSQQKFLSIYIDGDYKIHENDADLHIYGKYDKLAPKGIKIVFVPLNWILKAVFRQEKTMDLYKEKLDKIPSIDAKPENEKFFRVNIKGDLKRKDKLNIELKGIK